MIFRNCPKIYQNFQILFNLWTDKTIHGNLCKKLRNQSQKEIFWWILMKSWRVPIGKNMMDLESSRDSSRILLSSVTLTKYKISTGEVDEYEIKCYLSPLLWKSTLLLSFSSIIFAKKKLLKSSHLSTASFRTTKSCIRNARLYISFAAFSFGRYELLWSEFYSSVEWS